MVEVAGVPPGKVQAQAVAFAEELLAKETTSGPQPLVTEGVNAAEIEVEIVTISVEVLMPQAFVAVKTTE